MAAKELEDMMKVNIPEFTSIQKTFEQILDVH